MFKIIGGDGKEYGPVSTEQLTQWLAEGRVYHQTRAQREGTTEWKPLSEFPEWQTTFAPAGGITGSNAALGTPAAVHTLTTFPVAGLLALHFLTCGVFTLVWLNLMHGKMPRVRGDDPSAGKAVGFCFIPFFNWYWRFFTYCRLCMRVNEQRELYGLPPSNLTGLAITFAILMLIPYINILIGVLFVFPIFAAMIQSNVNELVRESATKAPQRTLPAAAPGSGGSMPGWAIGLIVAGCLLVCVAVPAAMLLPALAKAKERAQSINCVNDLKQVAIAFKVWGLDHNGEYPFNVSTNEGGTFELCDRDENGFDRNAAAHLRALSNELNSAKILVCASDTSKRVAADLSSLEGANISYTFISGTNVSDNESDMVLAFCPIHHNVMLTDGSVQRMTESQMQAVVGATVARVAAETRNAEERRKAGERVGMIITPDREKLRVMGFEVADIVRALGAAISKAEPEDVNALVVTRYSGNTRLAVKLSEVARIERRPADSLPAAAAMTPLTRTAPGGGVQLLLVIRQPQNTTPPADAIGTAPKPF